MWVQERLLRILRGEACLVAAGIRRSATRRKLTPDNRENVDQCADYLLNHASSLHYDECLAAGFPIATGVIEGACRHLVSDRMDLTGARWSLAGAEAVLRLRALRSSGDFDEYWRFHEQCEYERNHASRYADGKVVPVKGALLHGSEQIADLPVPVAESPGAVRIGHPERGHLVEYLAPNSVFNSLPRQRSSPHLRPDDRLVTIDRVFHHASLGAA